MMATIDKLFEINKIIEEIKAEDPTTAGVLVEGFGLALNILETMAKNEGRRDLDISEHIEIIGKILGVSLEDLIMHIVQSNATEQNSDKTPDQATLDFITSGMDDYEKFLAQNKAKDDLEFLSKSI